MENNKEMQMISKEDSNREEFVQESKLCPSVWGTWTVYDKIDCKTSSAQSSLSITVQPSKYDWLDAKNITSFQIIAYIDFIQRINFRKKNSKSLRRKLF